MLTATADRGRADTARGRARRPAGRCRRRSPAPLLTPRRPSRDVLFDRRRRGSIGRELGIERVGDVPQRVVADEIGHLEWSEHRDEGTQRGLDNRVELERIGGADVHEVKHLAQQCEPHPVPQEPRDLLAHPDRSQADVVAEAHRGRDRLLARLFSGDDLNKDDQLRLDRMDDDGSFGVGHARGEPRHRKVGCRAPQEDIGSDHRLDIPVARRLDLGVLDDRLHDRSAGSKGRGEVVCVQTRGPAPRRRLTARQRRSRPVSTRSGATGPATSAPTQRETRRVLRSRQGRTAGRTDDRYSLRRRGR